jgi:quinol monooxygenase YgiN
MLAVIGSFRFPPDRVAEALPLMQQVISATLLEAGYSAYSYAADVAEPELFRVLEMWDSRAALEAHFATPHRREWADAREGLGFSDRRVSVFSLGEGEVL